MNNIEEIMRVLRENAFIWDGDLIVSQNNFEQTAKEISQLNKDDEWISVNDRLPEEIGYSYWVTDG